MTEDEARTKWCPFVGGRYHRTGKGSAFYESNPVYNCIASDCMAWRWDRVNLTGKHAAAIGMKVTQESRDEGHCGLAGTP